VQRKQNYWFDSIIFAFPAKNQIFLHLNRFARAQNLFFRVKSKFFIYPFLLFVTAIILWSCSTNKDGVAYRIYHNTTAHFNGHFNAEESIKKGVGKLTAAFKPDYDSILPVFVIGTEETAKDAFAEMERAIEKTEKVINRHTIKKEANKDRKRPEYNKWIDENYMAMGRAYFYKRNFLKAEQVFKFVNGKYKDSDTQLSSATWLARTYTEMGEYSKATQALNRFEPEAENKDELKAEYYMALADNIMRSDKLEDAVKEMEKAISFIKKKKDRARPHFVLAQMYQQLNRSSDALTHYEAVLKSRPPYELEFYAKINKALSFSRRGGNSDEIKKELMKMLKDEKNESYRDQIYFALGDIELEEQHRDMAIYYFEQSLEVNVDNKKQKAKTFLKLADLYFDQRQYVQAQASYDSTFSNINEKHPRYREIKARAESLNELVQYINIIELNDSMVSLCNMSEQEREKALNKALRDAEAKVEEQKRKDAEALAKAQTNAAPGITGSFWAYNPTTRDKAKSAFEEYWGDRPLKDNWRLNSRLSMDFASPDESEITQVATEGGTIEDDRYRVPTIEELRASLPCGDEQKMKQQSASLAEAYYKAGVIYKENLDDVDNALDTWEQLVVNLDESDYHTMGYYQLYRTWLYKEQLAGYKPNGLCMTCSSQYWGDEIKSRYPGSEWAKLVDNPSYLDEKDVTDKQESIAYEAVYKIYVSGDYTAALGACNKVLAEEPNNHLICKYKIMRAICIGYNDAAYGIRDNFIQELQKIKSECPGTEEADRATEILKGLLQESTPEVKMDEGKKDGEGTQNPEGNPDTPKPSPFKFDESAEHYFAVVLPVQGTDLTSVRAAITDFNLQMFASSGYKVTNNLLDKNNHIILVKPFMGAQLAEEYMKVFLEDQEKLKNLNSAPYTHFLISKTNYIALFKGKNLDEYIQYYQENY
jgi:tetratricopeptide (TPR) repeat protein